MISAMPNELIELFMDLPDWQKRKALLWLLECQWSDDIDYDFELAMQHAKGKLHDGPILED